MPVWMVRRRDGAKRLVTYVLISDPTDERLMDVMAQYVERVGEPLEAVEVADDGTERIIGEAWLGR